jgi:hypothetical protein
VSRSSYLILNANTSGVNKRNDEVNETDRDS